MWSATPEVYFISKCQEKRCSSQGTHEFAPVGNTNHITEHISLWTTKSSYREDSAIPTQGEARLPLSFHKQGTASADLDGDSNSCLRSRAYG